MTTPPADTKAISKNTSITVGALGVFGVAAFSFIGLLISHFAGMEKRLDLFTGELVEINHSLKEIRADVADLNAALDGHISRVPFRAWLDVLQARNPELDIPEYRDE